MREKKQRPAGWFRVSDFVADTDKLYKHSALPDYPVVYFITAGDEGPIKIGFASRLRNRLHGLQTGNHERLKVLGWISQGTKEIESGLHRSLYRYRVRGDWFESCDEVWAVIANHARTDRD